MIVIYAVPLLSTVLLPSSYPCLARGTDDTCHAFGVIFLKGIFSITELMADG